MTLGILVGSVIKTTAITLLAEIAMKAIEQKDYARLIKFTGVSAIATDVVTYLKHLEENPPLLLKLTKESIEGWKEVISAFANFLKFFGVGK
jgi:hypothetical protein